MSSCGAWIQFVTPSDVRSLKTRLDPFVGALDASIGTCASVDAPTRNAWAAFLQSWRAYVASEDHFLTAGSEFNAGCEYETTIAGWQRTVGGMACGVPGPSLPDPALRGGDTATTNTVRTVAVAAGIVAVALTLRSLAR